MSLEACDLVDCFHDSIDSAIACANGKVILLGAAQGNFSQRFFSRACVDVEADEGLGFAGILDMSANQ